MSRTYETDRTGATIRIGTACAAMVASFAVCLAAGCAISPLGRHQLVLLPESEMASLGVAAYDKVKSEQKISTDAAANTYVHCVADAVTRALPPSARQSWEVNVFEDDTANAFALPGGKIGVNTGLLRVAKNQDQLAAVLGHEVAHVLARHSNERVSAAYATETSLQLAQAVAGASSPTSRQIFGLLGVGAQVGVLLPFSRTQESEADLVGLDLMAKAGFDPRQSIELWKNMEAASGGQAPPEFLSTHPSPSTRIADLRDRLPSAIQLEEAARAAGNRPSCAAPAR
jgi:predicted Zn-dependent protease